MCLRLCHHLKQLLRDTNIISIFSSYLRPHLQQQLFSICFNCFLVGSNSSMSSMKFCFLLNLPIFYILSSICEGENPKERKKYCFFGSDFSIFIPGEYTSRNEYIRGRKGRRWKIKYISRYIHNFTPTYQVTKANVWTTS